MAQYVRACMRDPMNTQGKHTKRSWCAYSECCAALVQRRLPTCFSGRYLWNSLALVQRPVAFTASYSPFTKGLVISKIPGVSFNTFPPWENGFQIQAALVDGWLEPVFPAADAVQTVTEVKEVPPEHLNQDDIQQHL